ncbi:MAG: cell division protein SepF [Lachnospiraceae bacterium]|nr:cell division protein SepF [Lachnospiraceae bacterium]
MGTTVDKFFKMMKMNNQGDEEQDGYDPDYDDEEYDDSPAAKRSSASDDDLEEERPRKVLSRPQGFRNPGSRKGGTMPVANSNMEVCVCKPTSFNDAQQLANDLLENRSVVLNLEGLDITLARRIFDFATGACYALRGRIEPISKFVYVITPESVYISGDTQEDSDVIGQGFGE